MRWFSKKEDKELLKDFDACVKEINSLSYEFRILHAKSVDSVEENFKKVKSGKDFDKERLLFEKQFDVLQKLKFHTDLLIEEGFRLVRNESVLAEKDRLELKSTESSRKKPAEKSESKKKPEKETKKTARPAKRKKRKAKKKPTKKKSKKRTSKKEKKAKKKKRKKKTTTKKSRHRKRKK